MSISSPPTSSPEPAVPGPVRRSPVRSIARSERLQLVLAGSLWAAAAGVLSWRGIGWLSDAPLPVVLAVAGVAAGALKARYILTPVAMRVTRRIHTRGPGAPIAGFFSVQSWVAVVIMMAGGHALRLTAIPRPVLGVLYVTIASALLIAGRTFWRAHAVGWDGISGPSARR